MKKLLCLTAAALAISSVHADTRYTNGFNGTTASAGNVTIKLSGYCKGSLTLPLDQAYAYIETDSDDADSYFEVQIPDLQYNYIGSYFEGTDSRSTSALTIQKQQLKLSAKTSSFNEGYYPTYDLKDSALGQAPCKDNQTFKQLVEASNRFRYLNWDNTLRHQASFSLQGKTAPFPYRYNQKSSGVLAVPQKCTITGDNTYNLASDSYKAVCKQDRVIKVSISANLKGEMNLGAL